jgi:DNA topoisomerase-1
MAKKVLVIVESPAKARVIGKLLGRHYIVKASLGHVRDLPKSQLGVDVENGFTPKYVTIRGKGEVIRELRETARQAEKVLLGPDPDREGEAIAWHLQNLLNLPPDSQCRIEFHEVTKKALEEAVKQPHPVNMNRVYAQQARRVLDRLVGYSLSPLLWRKIRSGLSAGRVQSVAVRLICEREEEIRSFHPEEYWTLTAVLKSGEAVFEAKLWQRGGEKVDLKRKEDVQEVLQELEGASYIISKITKKKKKRNPAPPFTTSTLQQEASRKLNFSVQKTMVVAQQLYEGLDLGEAGSVGLITYMRTDSTRVAEVAQMEARQFIRESFGPEYLPAKPPQYHSKGKAQDAHEAIRPTSVWRRPQDVRKFLTEDQFKLYKLIWERYLASQMSPALVEVTTVDVSAASCVFRVTGSLIIFPGFLQLAGEVEEEAILPPLSEGEILELQELVPKQHFTQPPPRFTEASLVKLLEEKGIGRPSTYAPIIETIQTRGYVIKEDKYFYPTELGFVVVDLLKQYFPRIIDVEFTANMEEKLDQVEEGILSWDQVVRDFYLPFKQELEHAESEITKIEVEEEKSEKHCPKCGRQLVIKKGRYGKFLACPGFPECRYTEQYLEKTGSLCPKCGAQVIVRKTKKGKKFYGCINYPECDFVSWDEPAGKTCPHCGHFLVYRGQARQRRVVCPECGACFNESELSPEAVEVK